MEHPIDVYVREQALLDALDGWLDDLFAPERAAHTTQLIVEAAANDRAHDGRVEQLQRAQTDARRRLNQYRRRS